MSKTTTKRGTDWQRLNEIRAEIRDAESDARHARRAPANESRAARLDDLVEALLAEQAEEIARGPAVGDLASFGHGADCTPYTVIAVSKTGAKVTLQERRVEFTDTAPVERGVRREYLTHENPEGATMVCTRRTRGGRTFYAVGKAYARQPSVGFGVACYNRDPSF